MKTETYKKALAAHIANTSSGLSPVVRPYGFRRWFTDTLMLLAVVAAGLAWLWG